MARWMPIPIAGGAYSDDARPWTCQDTVNYLPVPAEREGTRSPSILRSAPGYTTFCASMGDAPVRGLHNVEGLLLAVTGRTLYRIGTTGLATAIGTIPGVGRVSMAHNQITNGHEVVIANGQSGYLYKTTDGSFGQISDEAFPGLKAVEFVDGYIVGIEPAGRYWFHSDLLDASKYSTLDRYDAEATPDKMVALIVSHREVMVLNERSCQFFRNSGGDTGTFENNNGTEIEVGCAGTHAVARLDNTVYWLGNDNAVYRLSGHNPQRISTGPIEQAISRCNTANAYAFTFEDRGHKVFYLTFPDGETWGFDVWSGEWHRRKSQDFRRWRLSDLVRWNGKWIGGDFSNGRLYRLDWSVQHEDGAELERRRVMAVMHDNQNSISIAGLEIVIDMGLGESSAPGATPTAAVGISGDVPDGVIGGTFNYQYIAVGGVQPYKFSIVSGSLPDGLAMNDAGVVSGIATAIGLFAWSVRVIDAMGEVASLDDTSRIIEISIGLLGDGGGPFFKLSESGGDWSGPADYNGLSPMLPPTGLIGGGGRWLAYGANVTNPVVSAGRSGVDWEISPYSFAAETRTPFGCYSSGYFLIPATNGVYRSGDYGQSFDKVTDTETYSIAASPLVAVGIGASDQRCRVSRSPFASWSFGGEVGVSMGAGSFVAYGGGRFLVCGSDAPGGLPSVSISANDGATFSVESIPVGVTGYTSAAAYGNGTWVVGTSASQIMYMNESDGIWRLAAGESASAVVVMSIVHTGKVFVALRSAFGSASAEWIRSSIDGNVWSPAPTDMPIIGKMLAVMS